MTCWDKRFGRLYLERSMEGFDFCLHSLKLGSDKLCFTLECTKEEEETKYLLYLASPCAGS